MENNNSSISHIYLYEIPMKERTSFCLIMDELNMWSELAIRMGYDEDAIQVFFNLLVAFTSFVILNASNRSKILRKK